MNQHLKEPTNIIGTVLTIIGGVMMFGILFDVPDWIPITGIVLWAVGILVLLLTSHNKRQ